MTGLAPDLSCYGAGGNFAVLRATVAATGLPCL